MKTTTTLMEIMQSELINGGFNEFYNESLHTFFFDKYSFIKKIMACDDDTYPIITKKFFNNYSFDESFDREFKRTFINSFINRQPQKQTLEMFASDVVSLSLQLETYITQVYKNIDNYLQGLSNSSNNNSGSSLRDSRALNSDLPQDNINLNVDDTVLNYGNQNIITRDKESRDSKGTTQSTRYSIDDIDKLYDMKMKIFREYDRKCFLQIW